MKKILAVLLAVATLSLCVVPVAAVENTTNIIATYEDGSYLVEEVTTLTSNVSPWSTTLSKAGYRTARLYNGNDVEQWYYIIYANFLYREGIGSQPQYCWDDYEIYNTEWSMVEHKAFVDSTNAYGYYKFKQTVLFITIATASNTLGITCDCYGNITAVD